MFKFKGISIYDFRKSFQTETDCLTYLYDLKWSNGFVCSKCSHTEFYKGRTQWYRKCRKCSFDESVKSGTVFHKMKIPLLKAFEVLFMLSARKKGMSTVEISKTYDLNQDTAWLLKRKVQQSMFSSGKNQLKGKVHVDEFVVGGKEKGKRGRSSTSKKVKVLLACEVIKYKGKMTLGNAYATVIENYSSKQFLPFFNQRIDKTAKVKTDKWSSYKPIAEYYDIEQVKSEGGVNFKELNTLTMLCKGWLRGIHHKVSKQNMQHYLNEYFFRFNRKAHPKSSFHKLLENFMCTKPLFMQLREVCG